MQKMMKKVWQRRRGFTLIELLIVVAIIGILAGIAIPNFMGARTKAKVSRAFADMHNIGNALEMYYIDNQSYPTTPGAVPSALTPNYMGSIPKDPFNRSPSANRTVGGNNGDAMESESYGYAVTPTTTPSRWLIISNGPDKDADTQGGTLQSPYVSGQLGGPDGVSTGWYGAVWATGSSPSASGDLGYAGP